MQGWHDVAQLILQILSNPAWSGVSSICSLIGIPLAILLARKSKTSRPQKPQNLHYPPGGIRHSIRGSYRRVTLAKEFVKDVDICLLLSKN
jgi:hypothetical protein